MKEVEIMTDVNRIAKQRLNIIFLIDTSTSMRGKKIEEVNNALKDASAYLKELQTSNTNIDFYLSVISFSTNVTLFDNQKMVPINNFVYQPLSTGGQSNLHLAYEELICLLNKESNQGIMSDFGGLAPIIILITDGHVSSGYQKYLSILNQNKWFKASLRYGIAVELNDKKTIKVLKQFVNKNGEVIECYDSRLLEKIIKIVVLTASKAKTQSILCRTIDNSGGQVMSQLSMVQLQIEEAFNDVKDWEW